MKPVFGEFETRLKVQTQEDQRTKLLLLSLLKDQNIKLLLLSLLKDQRTKLLLLSLLKDQRTKLVYYRHLKDQKRAAVVNLNFRAGSTFCTVPNSMDRTSLCNKVAAVRLYASCRLNLLLPKGQICVQRTKLLYLCHLKDRGQNFCI